MSRYLIRRIEECPTITLRPFTQIEALEGDEHLERIRWRKSQTGLSEVRDIRHVFLMTGASPNTDWLNGCVALDDNHFIKTGSDLQPKIWERRNGRCGAIHTCWKRACPEYSRSETYGPAA